MIFCNTKKDRKVLFHFCFREALAVIIIYIDGGGDTYDLSYCTRNESLITNQKGRINYGKY